MIYKNVSLKKYNTFGLNLKTDYLVTINSEEEAVSVLQNSGSFKQPLLVLGCGSNLLFTKDFKGTIFHPEISGIKLIEKETGYAIISSGAGVIWDDLVKWTVDHGYYGLENLSLIPGMVGATPVQNIGAYGIEIKDHIEKVIAISLENGSTRELNNHECRFGYRDSVFKNELKGKYLIANVWFRLTTDPMLNIEYGSLRAEVKNLGGVNQKNVRQAVINIRTAKLPDPQQTGNAGSFFKNPVVDIQKSQELIFKYNQIPLYDEPGGGKKLAAGWLIDQCGWKGKRKGDAGVHEKQALVLVNYGSATGMQLLQLSEEIRVSVFEKFGIMLEREVEII